MTFKQLIDRNPEIWCVPFAALIILILVLGGLKCLSMSLETQRYQERMRVAQIKEAGEQLRGMIMDFRSDN